MEFSSAYCRWLQKKITLWLKFLKIVVRCSNYNSTTMLYYTIYPFQLSTIIFHQLDIQYLLKINYCLLKWFLFLNLYNFNDLNRAFSWTELKTRKCNCATGRKADFTKKHHNEPFSRNFRIKEFKIALCWNLDAAITIVLLS